MQDKKEEDGLKEKKGEDAVCLRREVGLLPAVSLIVGTVVGSGIFIAPKGVLINSGSVGLSLLVWALCGVLSLFGALCYAELGTTFTKSGGHYTYLLETLGPLPAFLRLWVEFLFIRPAVASYVSLAFGRYVVEPFFAPCAAPEGLIKLVSILGVTFVVAVNCWSVNMASRTQVTLTFIKMFALVLIIVPGVIALFKGRTENFQNGFEVVAWQTQMFHPAPDLKQRNVGPPHKLLPVFTPTLKTHLLSPGQGRSCDNQRRPLWPQNSHLQESD